jgi:hypothetical protein
MKGSWIGSGLAVVAMAGLLASNVAGGLFVCFRMRGGRS